ncbi:adenine phosphoribosyltransferase [Cephus cinctus]|uniref:Adenine phosphoribosyltransferase n=1 Tax=Cephus cinctus TaxID=211228 RepID=A0AAJ7BHV7_CEPCN|nr:adenine phosphoribosyltransferase [Cephus cinctus]
MEKREKLKIVENAIGTYSDFPKPGIIFRDIFGVCQNVVAFRALRDLIVEHVMFLEVDIIVGLDSRGFLFGPLISLELGKPFVPIRKKGKLPGHVLQQSFVLEYGEDYFEIQTNSISEEKRVLIVDDLLASGGTMAAAVKLLKTLHAEVVECLVIMELKNLDGRSKVDAPVYSFIEYN